MKKTIATKRIKRWQRLDRLVLGVPPENERIIEDIFSMRNLRYRDYTHFKNWEEHRNE